MPDFLTADELAGKLRVTPAQIRQWCRERKLPHTRIGHRYLFSPTTLDRVIQLASQPAKPRG
jgi:excisionase family DNA binding protein